MHTGRPRIRIRYSGPRAGVPATGWFGKIVAIAMAGVLVAAALVFSLLLFAVLLSVGLVAGGYIWWRTRALRRQLREQFEAMQARPPEPPAQGAVIEGEYTRAPGSGDARRR